VNYAKIPAAYGRAHLLTQLPASAQGIVSDGVQAADAWIANDHGRTHEEYLLLHLRNLEESQQRAFSDGYFGRIHQRLKSVEDFDPSSVIAAGSEMTQALLELVREGVKLARKGKLKAKSFEARDYLVRLERLEASITEIPPADDIRQGGANHE